MKPKLGQVKVIAGHKYRLCDVTKFKGNAKVRQSELHGDGYLSRVTEEETPNGKRYVVWKKKR
jgi:hypothetical protein